MLTFIKNSDKTCEQYMLSIDDEIREILDKTKRITSLQIFPTNGTKLTKIREQQFPLERVDRSKPAPYA